MTGIRWRLAALLLATTALAGCDSLDLFGDKPKAPLPGDRIAVLALERSLEPDARIVDLEVRLPRPYVNEDWPQPGGYPGHAMHHLSLSGDLKEVWRADIGTGRSSYTRLLASPVVASGQVFVMDADSRVSAFDTANGRRQWRTDLVPDSEDSGAIGGGIVYDRGRVFAATAYGEVVALDPAAGTVIWRYRAGVPLRAAPTAEGGRVFVITQDNQLRALNGDTGEMIWSYTGIAETAALVGAGSVAVDGGTLVVPFSSGELFALRAENGTVAWNDALLRSTRSSSVANINDIAGHPVIDRGLVFAIGHAGRMVAIDARTGERQWERELTGVETPWVAGDFIYVVTVDGEVACISRRDGRIRWVQALQRWRNPDAKTRKSMIIWHGPILAGDRLVLAGSHGEAVSLSPYTGDVLGRIKLSDGAAMAPIVADNTLYVLTDNAYLVALK